MKPYIIIVTILFSLICPRKVSSAILISNENFYSMGSVICIDDVCFNKKQIIHGNTVPLRGVAEVKFAFIKIYSAAFYVCDEAESLNEILDKTPKQLSIKYHRSINRKNLIKIAEKHLRKNSEIDFDKFKDKIDKVSDAYESVKFGDQYDLVYYPGEGLELFLNGESKVKIKGDDFANYYFTIWISPYPYNKNLTNLLTQHIGETEYID